MKEAEDVDPGKLTDYEVIKKLGSGGFADVFLVRTSTGNEIALKKPLDSVMKALDDKNLRRFIDEAEHWKKLYSQKEVKKGIVAIYSYALEPEPYIAMEYMDSGNLREQMDTMDFDQKKTCLELVLHTLYQVHFLGAVHRDMKPENVLYNSKGEWKIGDWGLSKVLLDSTGSTTQTNVIHATLAYAAPEQIDSEEFGKADRRTDIYQVGAMAYELFAGQKPFEGEPAKIVFSVMSKEPKHPCEVNPEIPKGTGDAIMKALSKDKDERWQDALTFQRALFGQHDSSNEGRQTYREVLAQALEDGVIIEEERLMLERMRTMLNISDADHDELMADVLKEMEERKQKSASEDLTVEIDLNELKKQQQQQQQ